MDIDTQLQRTYLSKNVLEFQALHSLQNPLYHPICNGLTDNFNGVRGTVKNASREVPIH